MAGSPGTALDLLDGGLTLFRRSFRSAGWIYCLGSAPFAAAFLWAAQRVTSPVTFSPLATAAVLVAAYLVRALALGVYSRRVAASLGAATRSTHGWRRLDALLIEVALRGLLVFLWLVTAPIAVLLCPLYATAQQVPLSAGEAGPRAWALLKTSGKLAWRWQTQQWLLLMLLVLVWGVVFCNLGAAAVILPQLLQAIFGIHTALSLPGAPGAMLQSWFFWAGLVLTTYLAVDPVVKCVWVLAYFRLSAERSGADLAAAIAALRPLGASLALAGAALAVALLGGMAIPARAAAPPPQIAASAPVLTQAIQAELRQPQYAWRSSAQVSAHLSWLDRILHQIARPLNAIFSRLSDLLNRLLNWLRRLFGLSPAPAPPTAHPGRNLELRDVAWLLAVVCGLAALAVLWRRRRQPSLAITPTGAPATPVDVATATGEERPEEEWLRLALELQAAGEYRLALRAAFLAGLAGLARRGLLTIRRDRTNREYLREYVRRAQLRAGQNQDSAATFGASIRTFNSVWYGGAPVDGRALEAFLAQQRELLGHA